MRGGGTRKEEVLDPRLFWRREVRIHIRAMKNVARPIGVDHLWRWNEERRHAADKAAPVVPDEALGPERHAADADPFLLQQFAHAPRIDIELLAHPLGADRDIDKFQEF